MRHRIKKTPTLSKLSHIHNNNHHLLHSDKSDNNTYFYNNTNGKIGNKLNFLYSSKISIIPLVLSAFGLLLVLGMMLSPCNSAGSAYAVTTEDLGNGASISLSILNNNTEVADDGEVSTDVNVGQMSYIDNIVRVNTTKIGRYYVGVQTTEGSSNELTNEDGVTIGVVGDNKSIDDFSDNTWGYVLTSDTTASNDTLHYNTLPTYNTSNTLQYQSPDNPADGNHDLKLTFAAKIRADKPGGHYRTKAMVSVAAEAKTLLTLVDLTYMQDMTTDICSRSIENETNRLVDNRDTTKSYQITKLKGDVGCWMTENMDYDGGLRMYHDDTYGGYYNWGNAKEVCEFTGWQLPTQTQYDTLLSVYNISNSPAGSERLRTAPFNFLYSGMSYGGAPSNAGKDGEYWASTLNNGAGHSLGISSGYARVGACDVSRGQSVRCVAR